MQDLPHCLRGAPDTNLEADLRDGRRWCELEIIQCTTGYMLAVA